MSSTKLILAAARTADLSTHGETLVAFQPTAARCSSSSSTCCVGCVQM